MHYDNVSVSLFLVLWLRNDVRIVSFFISCSGFECITKEREIKLLFIEIDIELSNNEVNKICLV